MKRNYISRLALLLFAVMMGQNVMAQEPELGIEPVNGVYPIHNLGDWNELAWFVEQGGDTEGMTFVLMSDIVGETDDEIITDPVGCQLEANKPATRMRFAGTFDGQGHTIQVDLVSNDDINPNYCAPFAYCKGATIKNLHVIGHISTTGTFAGGLVGSSGTNAADGTITIENCEVAVEMECNYLSGGQGSGKYANQAGFVGIAEGNATITNSWFSGKLTGADFAYSGGFIALNKGQANLTDCLFVPSQVSAYNLFGSSEFVHANGGKHKLTGCYYTVSFSEPESAQGAKVVTAVDQDDVYETIEGIDGNTYYIVKHYATWISVKDGLTGTDETIALSNDITAGTEDAALIVPANRNVTLNLNGHTIDRALDITSAKSAGYVILVEQGATLTVKNGTIRGSRNNGNGGGILNNGTLTLEDVVVTGNYASKGAGIYNAGTLNVQGDVQVTGNTNNNVYLPTGSVINVTGALDAAASIGVTTQANTAGTVVSSVLGTNGIVTNFVSDNTNFHIAVYEDGDDAGKAYLSDAEAVEVSLANAGDNTQVINDNNGNLANVTLADRTIWMDGDWNTLCLPFDITFQALKNVLGNNITVNKLTEASLADGTLTINFAPLVAATASIPAGTPFIVKGTGANKSNVTFNKVIIKKGLNDVTFNNVSFKGTYSPLNFEEENKNILFMGSASTLYYPESGASIYCQRAFFQIGSNNVKAIVLTFGEEDDNATAIESVDAQRTANGAIYNLAGQRINKMQKGINIVNGKKVVIK